MRRVPTLLPGLVLLEPSVHGDGRGFLLETYRSDAHRDLGVDADFVQDNHSRSRRGVLRGLHYQEGLRQAKLVHCARGAIFDVAVDVRPGSPTFGQWEGVELTEANHRQLYVPGGFAHGFCVVSEQADVLYKLSTYYDAELERGVAFDDPGVGIVWPVQDPIVSVRDQANPRLAKLVAATSG